MFIHIGNREIVSDEKIIGIFNADTLEMSERNEEYLDEMKSNSKTVIIDDDDEVILSIVSSYTIIKRTAIDSKDCIYIRGNN